MAVAYLIFLLNSFINERHRHISYRFLNCFTLGLGIVCPILMFELWKIYTLGFDEWIVVWTQHAGFIKSHGISQAQGFAIWDERLAVIKDRFILSPITLVCAALIVVTGYIKADSRIRIIISYLFIGFILHLFYWVHLSLGKPRYIFTGVVLLCFLVSFSVAFARGFILRALGVAFVVFLFSQGINRLNSKGLILIGRDRSFSDLQLMASYIEQEYPNTPIGSQWWAHSASLEYLSTKRHRYSDWNEPRTKSLSKVLIIVDSKWDAWSRVDDKQFDKFLSTCDLTKKIGRYSLFRCQKINEPQSS